MGRCWNRGGVEGWNARQAVAVVDAGWVGVDVAAAASVSRRLMLAGESMVAVTQATVARRMPFALGVVDSMDRAVSNAPRWMSRRVSPDTRRQDVAAVWASILNMLNGQVRQPTGGPSQFLRLLGFSVGSEGQVRHRVQLGEMIAGRPELHVVGEGLLVLGERDGLVGGRVVEPGEEFVVDLDQCDRQGGQVSHGGLPAGAEADGCAFGCAGAAAWVEVVARMSPATCKWSVAVWSSAAAGGRIAGRVSVGAGTTGCGRAPKTSLVVGSLTALMVAASTCVGVPGRRVGVTPARRVARLVRAVRHRLRSARMLLTFTWSSGVVVRTAARAWSSAVWARSSQSP